MKKPLALAILVAAQLGAAQAAAVDGIQLYKQGKYLEAATALNAQIKTNKNTAQLPTLYYYLACCYYSCNDPESAKRAYRYIRNTYPTSPEARMAGDMLARLDPQSAAAQPTTRSSIVRESGSGSSDDTAAAVSALKKALTQARVGLERGRMTSADELAKLPDSNKFYFKREGNGHMAVTPMINGSPIACWFDTGAGAHFGMNHLKAAGIDTAKARPAGYTRGWAGTAVPVWSMPMTVRLGNLTRNLVATIEENMTLNPLIGQDFVDGYQYEIDDKAGVVSMKKSFGNEQAVSSLYDVPCRLERGDDVFEMTANGRKYTAFVDTGAANTIINYGTARKIGLEIPDDAEVVWMTGVGGNVSMRVCYYDLRLGPITRKDFRVLVGGQAGNCIGQDFMEGWRFKVDRQKNLIRFFH
jgi:predicted aspartyl protease